MSHSGFCVGCLPHSTLQTQQGGDIWLLGPSGNIRAGSLAPEPNPNLKDLNKIGILTLSRGDILSFTHGSFLLNSSRALTEFGGDVFAWSSNGDLDAGRGSRTTVSVNALKVNIDNTNYQTIDLGGLVSGAGFATLQTSPDVPPGDVTLLAPNGVVDAGDAGIRVSGNLVIVAPTVLNADNIKVGGSAAGLPPVAPSSGLSGLSVPANTTPTPANPVDSTPTGATGTTQGSIVIVEVTGYGGGDGTDEDGEQNSEKKRQSPNEQPPASGQ